MKNEFILNTPSVCLIHVNKVVQFFFQTIKHSFRCHYGNFYTYSQTQNLIEMMDISREKKTSLKKWKVFKTQIWNSIWLGIYLHNECEMSIFQVNSVHIRRIVLTWLAVALISQSAVIVIVAVVVVIFKISNDIQTFYINIIKKNIIKHSSSGELNKSWKKNKTE